MELLIQLFGYSTTIQIVSTIRPPGGRLGTDRLIFDLSQNGDYSVKKAYQYLIKQVTVPNSNPPTQGDAIWKVVWKKGNICPRVRLFLWKLVNGALPLAAILAQKTSRGDPSCATCGEGDETATHMAFLCPFSRLCWFAGRFPVRSESLTGSVKEGLCHLASATSDEEWDDIVNTLWSIWRCRNEKAYQGKTPTIASFNNFMAAVSFETKLVAMGELGDRNRGGAEQGVSDHALPDIDNHTLYQCHVDGSWVQPWSGGAGCWFTKGEELVLYRASGMLAASPLQAEAVSLREAIEQAKQMQLEECTFYSDSQGLVRAVMAQQPPLETEWKAFSEVYSLWCEFKKRGGYKCFYIRREENCTADRLARMGRMQGETLMGYTYPMF